MKRVMFYTNYIKRILDFLGASILLFVFLIPLIIILLAYFVTGEFPIFFAQERMGRMGLPFKIWKFRTLSAQEELPLQKRRFPLGVFLRKTNLDELPQLWNVLRGDMSMIGPRPLPIEYKPLLSKEQCGRGLVRPGITGWAQVQDRRHAITWHKKFAYDLEYVTNLSFAFDLQILFKTIVVMFSFKEDHSLEEQKFTGN